MGLQNIATPQEQETRRILTAEEAAEWGRRVGLQPDHPVELVERGCFKGYTILNPSERLRREAIAEHDKGIAVGNLSIREAMHRAVLGNLRDAGLVEAFAIAPYGLQLKRLASTDQQSKTVDGCLVNHAPRRKAESRVGLSDVLVAVASTPYVDDYQVPTLNRSGSFGTPFLCIKKSVYRERRAYVVGELPQGKASNIDQVNCPLPDAFTSMPAISLADLQDIYRSIGLSRVEAQYAIAKKHQGFTQHETQVLIGVSSRELSRIRRKVDRHQPDADRAILDRNTRQAFHEWRDCYTTPGIDCPGGARVRFFPPERRFEK